MAVPNDRDQRIVADRMSGMTYTAMEIKYGLTRERCRQICRKAGLPRKNVNYPTHWEPYGARRRQAADEDMEG